MESARSILINLTCAENIIKPDILLQFVGLSDAFYTPDFKQYFQNEFIQIPEILAMWLMIVHLSENSQSATHQWFGGKWIAGVDREKFENDVFKAVSDLCWVDAVAITLSWDNPPKVKHREPLSKEDWNMYLATKGRVKTSKRIHNRILRAGCSPETRSKVLKSLLGVLHFSEIDSQRIAMASERGLSGNGESMEKPTRTGLEYKERRDQLSAHIYSRHVFTTQKKGTSILFRSCCLRYRNRLRSGYW